MKVNVERLEQLRRVVIAAPDDRFRMERFRQFTDCGTAFCAAGWAAFDPWFQQNTDIGEYIVPVQTPDGVGLGVSASSFNRLSITFGISPDSTNFLFDGGGSSGVTKDDVIANIDRLVVGLDAEPYGDPYGESEDDE